MMVTCFSLTGYSQNKIAAEKKTISEFNKIKNDNPKIQLDQAILIFENAKKGLTLEEFAKNKTRLAKSYRKIYKPYFK